MEPNPDFIERLREAGAGKKGVILACEAGGTTRPTPSFQFGKASRSLTAAFRRAVASLFIPGQTPTGAVTRAVKVPRKLSMCPVRTCTNPEGGKHMVLQQRSLPCECNASRDGIHIHRSQCQLEVALLEKFRRPHGVVNFLPREVLVTSQDADAWTGSSSLLHAQGAAQWG